jgi:ABC-2 type transport system permease protein
MNYRRILAVTKKEYLHILRDPRSLGMGIAIPMLLLFLFGYALTLDVDRVPLIVWDQDGTTVSRDYLNTFSGSRYFTLIGGARGYADIEDAIDGRKAIMAMVIPARFASMLASGEKAKVQIIVDGSDSNTATIALGYAEAVSGGYSRQVATTASRLMGRHLSPALIDLRPRVWYNADMSSRNYIFPGLIAVIMMVIAALLTSLTMAREWESGTMEQLISTPLKGPELIIGKLIPYFSIGILDLILSVLVGEMVFHIPLRGSILLLVMLSVIFLIGALSFGMLISIATKSQLLSSQFALVTTVLPAFLLSGFMFPIANMPLPIRGLTHIITARYFVYMLRGIYMKDVGLGVMAGEVLFLVLFCLVVLTLCFRKFRKKIV